MPRYSNDYMFADKHKNHSRIGCVMPLLIFLAAAGVIFLLLNVSSSSKLELRNEKVSVMSLDKSYEGFTILHISDLHASDSVRDLDMWRNLLYGSPFQAVVMTGDMVGSSGNDEPLLSLIHNLQAIKPSVPIFIVAGDDDPDPVLSSARGTPEVFADWVTHIIDAGATYLDAPVFLEAANGKVWLIPESLYDIDIKGMVTTLTRRKAEMESQGRQYEAEGGASYRALCYRLDVMERTQAAIEQMQDADLQVAVSHAPLSENYIRANLDWADRNSIFSFRTIDLLLCGHYCSGQWLLPGIGPVYVPDIGWFPKIGEICGMQRINSLNQYISPGIGASEYYPMKGRFCNPPAVTLLKFTSSLH